jgi:hypothetical protein
MYTVCYTEDCSEGYDDRSEAESGSYWKVRHGANLLAQSLIRNFPDAFLERLNSTAAPSTRANHCI